MIRLFWAARTRSSRLVWMLEELGEDYERVVIDLRDPTTKTDPDFVAASPMGKVPALADDTVRMSESAAICLYLADRYAMGRLAPALDAPERGPYLYWMMFTPAVLEPAMSEKVNGTKPNPQSSGWGSFDIMLETLIQGLGDGPWIMGDDFTAADVMVGGSVAFMKMFNMLPDSAVLNAYVDRCLARPAYQKALALDAD